jgi:hypothetical protein
MYHFDRYPAEKGKKKRRRKWSEMDLLFNYF